ncbi:ATP-binding cassette domain-containing protein [Methylomonas sp. MO1]|uniref:peptidase domain-containing ABC transporter n=1 Tax=Methylomonas sp. MO1 TaxID=3073619 RepID=UPI0028A3CE6D|nr:ATP-binding cassette domain-containing protein [Methylomonas sp. MO1]MDT4292233.1 ATP-binding cassette domain-containing protein [Methylomonas sp. MO1]
MSTASGFKEHPHRKQSTLTLLEFLFGLLEMHSQAQGLTERLIESAGDDTQAALVAIGDHLGLNMESVLLTPTAAANASAPQTPLLTSLSDGYGWIVLYGFRGGKVRVALAQGEVIEERLVKPADIGKLLGRSDAGISEWLLAQAQAPFENAVSQDHHAHLPPFRRLLELLRADRHDLWLLLGLALGSGLLALASPVAVQALVNTVAMGGMGQPLIVLATILFFFLSFAGAVYVLESYLVEIVQRRIFVRLAADLAYRLPRVRSDTYDSQHGAELVNRFFDVLTLQKAGSSLLLDGLSTVVQTCVGLIMLAFYHPFLLAFDVVLLLAITAIVFLLGRGAVTTAIQESISKYALVAWLENVAGNIQTFKFGNGAAMAANRTDKLALDYLTAKRRHYRVLLEQVIASVALYAIASTALLAIGGYLVIDGHLTLGQLVAAELIVSSALLALIKFGKHLEGFYDLMAGTDKIGHLLDLPLETSAELDVEFNGPASLTISNLKFGFNSQRPLFADFSMHVQPGEKVAILGGPGSGKTALASLLSGMRQAQAGQIQINRQALDDLRLSSLRQNIAVVSRLEIFHDSMLENVRLGDTNLSVTDVERALAKVGLTDINLDTVMSPGGSPLAHSQAIQVMLARAIIASPALLIVDGILDGLDTGLQQQLAPALFAADAPWTLLLLTGATETAALCQRVIHLPGAAHD